MKRIGRFLSARRLRRRPALEFTLGADTYRFGSPLDFEFALAGRTTIPAAKFGDILRMDASELNREARALKKMERRFIEALEACVSTPGSIGVQLHDLGAKVFSKDHLWRSIAKATAALGPQHDECKKIVLVKYMQYLEARRDAIAMVYEARTGKGADLSTNWDKTGTDRPAEAVSHQETAAFSAEDLAQEPYYANAYMRLPRGQAVLVRIDQRHGTDILLSKHRFVLRNDADSDTGLALLDDEQRVYRFGQGQQHAGRSIDNNIVVDNGYRCVSRKHLVAEVIGDDLARITDLSAHGTFVPPEAVVRHSNRESLTEPPANSQFRA